MRGSCWIAGGLWLGGVAAAAPPPPPPKPPVQAVMPAPPAPRAQRPAEPLHNRRPTAASHQAAPRYDREAIELREREVFMNRRASLLAARADRLERRIEGLREPGASREDASVVPGGIEGLRARLEEERTRLAEAQSRLNYERTELERERLRQPR